MCFVNTSPGNKWTYPVQALTRQAVCSAHSERIGERSDQGFRSGALSGVDWQKPCISYINKCSPANQG
jgi:hypothetical protein